jgi:hypothetical protein
VGQDRKFKIECPPSPGAEPRLVNRQSGEAIPDDEPVFFLRARDRLALPLLHAYEELCIEDDCTDEHMKMLSDTILEFDLFALQHPERMKQPGVTLGKKPKPVTAE